ncbi:single-stranded-DNA-specific exonuclease RecJ [Campylobacter sp. RM12654]|uniref:single-stranded-DNA-specific exonuclease RecJ n=1 Tax=unclassified Campylobacter TaxID=2593542 RepID=UPI001EFC0525|nr:single-stranded-DNA-specific exonuclease RecJ [Campylobacter sp. RM12651]MBZ7978013.1 single-stranded-DNA-specific exonuclease RecJ [Campylobacter sp. RM12654]ULO02515.1 single-stranded DNA-specific exonuclease [Campylobacter sp. RM12651]
MLTLNKTKIKQVLEDRFKNDFHKSLSTIPKPHTFKDMNKAAIRIAKAIKNKEKIAVVGDYDVDGIVSSTIMSEFFANLGVEIIVKIPNRFSDGYGISEDIVSNLDASLIITVDNGIVAYEAANKCKELGIDLIISDHHTPGDTLPNAYAVINPKRDDCEFSKHINCEICGAQVAWWLCGAIKKELDIEYNMASFLDLLCIAIVADMMNLNDLNHILVRYGLKELNKLNRPAFVVLKEKYKKKFFDYESIPFLIAPLLNASGRMDDASISYKFLRAKSLNEAKNLLEIIEKLNQDRKEQEKQSFLESIEFANENDKVIIAYSKNWHKGILGIVAGRLAKQFNKPSFVFNIEDDLAKGSARSVAELDILELLSNVSDILTNYGGHKGAAGLALKVEHLKEFKTRLNNLELNYNDIDFCDTTNTLGELEFSEIDMELLDILSDFEPFGQGNEKPFFISKGVIIKNLVLLNEKHLKCTFTQNNLTFEAICFNCDFIPFENECVNIHYSLQKNYFKPSPTIQLNISNIYI